MRLSWNEIRQRAIGFSHEWREAARERAEAQTFWNEFFQVFGVRRRTVAGFEEPVRNLTGSLSFIDLFWPGTLLAEHKSRGQSLGKAESQALAYIRALKDDDREHEAPRYVVVSDFARVAIHDLDSDRSAEFAIEDFHDHVHEFAFIPGYKREVTDPEDPANIKAAEMLATLKDRLEEGGYPARDLERFMVRILFCLFGEDTGLLGEPDAFRLYIENSTKPDGSDLGHHLAHWFEVLDTPADERQAHLDEQLRELPFVNGELFAERLTFASFDRPMRDQLLACSRFHWATISPAVFGSLFQSIMEPPARRQIGAHYTSERDILKVLEPLFLAGLRERLEKARNDRRALMRLQRDLGEIRILDPACGCGNFLVIAYRELRSIELEILRALHPGQERQQVLDIRSELLIDVGQMHGLECSEWPVRIAEVALWLMDHQMNMAVSSAFGQYVARLPLEHSASVVQGNALRTDWEDVLPADRCTYVLGNPPFVGKKARTPEQVEDMGIVFGARKGAGSLDYVCCWYELASRYAAKGGARVAFVSTSSIAQGEQPGVLWPAIFERGQRIEFAHRTFPWESDARGKAHVHVVIIGFGQANVSRAIFDYDAKGAALGAARARNISPYLAEGPSAAVTNRSAPIASVPPMVFGNMPNDGGHLLLDDEARAALVEAAPGAEAYVRPLISSKEFLSGRGRWCLWLVDASPAEIRKMPAVLQRIESVRAYREKSRRAATKALAKVPMLFGEIRQPEHDYVFVPRHSSERRDYVPLAFLKPESIVHDSCLCVPDATLYHFGVLHSAMHMAWLRHVGGRLESRYRCSAKLVYNNFPWPEEPTPASVEKVEAAASAVLDARQEHPQSSLADLYDPLTMPAGLRKAHASLDRAVDRCYRRSPFPDERRRFEFLFESWAEAVDVDLDAGESSTDRASVT
ncbi:MAG: DNA methyltransferase [Planctomycetota bacterium]